MYICLIKTDSIKASCWRGEYYTNTGKLGEELNTLSTKEGLGAVGMGVEKWGLPIPSAFHIFKTCFVFFLFWYSSVLLCLFFSWDFGVFLTNCRSLYIVRKLSLCCDMCCITCFFHVIISLLTLFNLFVLFKVVILGTQEKHIYI